MLLFLRVCDLIVFSCFLLLLCMHQLLLNAALVTDNAAQIKDLQRESYFINLERKRKLGTVQKMKEEIEINKRRAMLQKSIEARIKKEVRLNCFVVLLVFVVLMVMFAHFLCSHTSYRDLLPHWPLLIPNQVLKT